MSDSQQKGLHEYYRLMKSCFAEYYRVLKPGRWMTVVFSNTQAAVWNGIRTALARGGVRYCQRFCAQQGSGQLSMRYQMLHLSNRILVITAYKPNGGLEARFSSAGWQVDSVWDFVRTHLGYLPSVKMKGGELEFIQERDPRIIFDRMVAWFVGHNSQCHCLVRNFRLA
jgi:hypothetical protein